MSVSAGFGSEGCLADGSEVGSAGVSAGASSGFVGSGVFGVSVDFAGLVGLGAGFGVGAATGLVVDVMVGIAKLALATA